MTRVEVMDKASKAQQNASESDDRPIEHMKASIIIPTKNGGERYERVLKALFDNAVDGGFEVIAIDSGSLDDTLRISHRYPVRLYEIPPEEFGHGKVRNLGAQLSQGEFLVYLTQDAIPASRDWLRTLLNAFTLTDNVAGVYSRQLPDGTNPMESFFLLDTYGEQHIIRSLAPDRGPTVSLREIFFSDVGSAIRRAVWEKIPYPGTIVMSEDQDWSKRVLLAGYKTVYEPAAAVYHSHNYTLRTIFKRNYVSGYSLHGIVRERLWPTISHTISYLTAEARYITKTLGWMKVPQMLFYEMGRYAGFAAGNIVARMRKGAV